jgi:hypothetical protein
MVYVVQQVEVYTHGVQVVMVQIHYVQQVHYLEVFSQVSEEVQHGNVLVRKDEVQ